MYTTIEGLDSTQTRLYYTFFLSQFFGAGKSRFILEFKKQLESPSILESLHNELLKVRSEINEDKFTSLVNFIQVRIECHKLKKMKRNLELSSNYLNPAFIEEICNQLNGDSYKIDSKFFFFLNCDLIYLFFDEILVIYNHHTDLEDVFEEYSKKIETDFPVTVIISIDEFDPNKLYWSPEDVHRKDLLNAFWKECFDVSQFLSTKNIYVIWVYCGRDISFLKVKGTGETGPPTSIHWISLECLKHNHVKNIILDLQTSNYLTDPLFESSLEFEGIQCITNFTGGVPRYLLMVLCYLDEYAPFRSIDDLIQKMKAATVKYSKSYPSDFSGKAELSGDREICAMITHCKMMERFKIPFDDNEKFKTITGI
eukprot:gb/GECH01008947.1/.p1 GENE.gb/GECH01008947.1/~~gb/GECH01008947.1/.p1  ORF type:complete len:369 (+),score=35.36 gb/GECH01008947.1/:1-1107(+)